MKEDFTESDRAILSSAVITYSKGEDPNKVITPELGQVLGYILTAYESDHKFIMETMTSLIENIYKLGYLSREEIKDCILSMKEEGKISAKETITEFFEYYLDGRDIKKYLAIYYKDNVIPEIKKETLTKQ